MITNQLICFSNATPALKTKCKRQLIRLAHRISRKPAAHFLHIGKTGGTAIIDVLRQYAQASPYFVYHHPHYVRLIDIPKGEKVFFFLRDPITRFVSGFYSRQRQGKPRHNLPWSVDEEIVLKNLKALIS